MAGRITAPVKGAPRRLTMRTARAPSEVESASRKAAGEDSRSLSGGRKSIASAWPLSAASCRRRKAAKCLEELLPGSQASTAPQAFEASACSVAQSVSFSERVLTITR